MTSLRTLLVGVDHPHGPLWRESLRNHQGFNLIGAVDTDSDRARTLLARESLQLDVVDDLDAAINRFAPDAALIALPNDVTPQAITHLARAGIPMIAEKPCATSAMAFEPAMRAVEDAGVPFLPAYLRRFSPVAAAIRDRLHDGSVGKLVSITITFATSNVALRNAAYLAAKTIEEVRGSPNIPVAGPSGDAQPHWLFDRDRSGGGIMHWLGVHWLDLVRMVTGEEVAEVSATLATRGAAEIDVEDVAAVTLTMQSGAVASVTCAYTLPSGPDRTTVEIHGTKGWIAWDGSSPAFTLMDESAALPRTIALNTEDRPGYAGALGWATLDAFRATVTSGTPLLAGPDDALRALELLGAIHLAHREGRRVTVSR